MKLIAAIILSFLLFSFDEKEPAVIQYRSFYAEMKALEKPEKVYAFGAVQTATNTGTTVNTLNTTVSSTGTNNLLVVSVWTLSLNAVTSITDNQFNTYVIGSAYTISGAFYHYQAYGFQIAGSVTQVTVNTSGNTSIVVIVDEFSGFTGTPTNAECYDTGSDVPAYVASTSISTTNFSPINTGCLIVGSAVEANGGTVGSSGGYTKYGTSTYFGSNYHYTNYKLSGTMGENCIFSDNIANGTYYSVIGKSFKQENATPPAATGKAIRSSGINP